METAKIPSLEQLQEALGARLLGLAAFLNISLGDTEGNSPGNRALRLDTDEYGAPWDMELSEIEVRRYRVGRMLPFLYDYAYHGKRGADSTLSWSEWRGDYDDREVFKYFLSLTAEDGIVNIDLSLGDIIAKDQLNDMLNRADARQLLDSGEELSISDIALLANMNEKSVSNALRAEGDHRLVSADGEHVENAEALRWLRSRRGGFKETTISNFSEKSQPDSLTYAELAPFIQDRLKRLYPDGDEDVCLFGKAAKVLGWSSKRVYAVTEDAGNIRPEDCEALAKALRVDVSWFTEQVMCALFPKQMALVMYRREFEIESNDESPSIEVRLTEKGIKNGYLDIPADHALFFPEDCFGGRGSQEKGVEIELRYGGTSRMTDIRRKSSITISPRARFVSYFNAIQAKPGDVMKIARLGDRTYELLAAKEQTGAGG
ncbi:hypothetical protein NNRS527_00142 [Nitrosospira sp. NRS527]|nr:hypothetical protein NNRS527_00142 [Nitrosospira sp. NRS527]